MGGASTNKDYHGVLGISKSASVKDIYRAYRSLVMKWHPDKNPSNKTEAEDKFREINEAYNVLNEQKKDEIYGSCDEPTTPGTDTINDLKVKTGDENFFRKRYSFLSRNSSRRSKTPTPSKPSMAKSASRRSCTPTESRRSTTPTFFRRSKSKRDGDETDPTPTFLRNASRAGSVNRDGNETDQPPSFTRSGSRATGSTRSVNRDGNETDQPPSFTRSGSRATGPTPIIFSSSTARMKPPPVEKMLECTLEDLYHGCVKKIKIARDVMSKTGQIETEEEILQIRVKPGWKKGTKITFEGKGDEKLGTHPADVIFVIDEKKHPFFRRRGNDLEILVEIPLLKALTGCSISVPLLGGEKMSLSFDNVIYPGFEKIIQGQGMPNPKEEGRRGNLHIKFLVKFPTELSDEQRQDVYSILCC